MEEAITRDDETENEERILALSENDINELLDFDASELDEAGQNVIQIAKRVAVSRTIVSSGPLPPAEELLKYESACSGAADRIISMAENEASHRRHMDELTLKKSAEAMEDERKKEFTLSAMGSVFAFVVCLVVILSGCFCISNGQSAEGLGCVIAALGSLVGVFIYSRNKTKETSDSEK